MSEEKDTKPITSRECIGNLVDYSEHLLIAKDKVEAKKLCDLIIGQANYIKARWLNGRDYTK